MLDRVNRSMSPTSQSHVIGSFSQLGLFHNHGGPNAHHMPTAAEDILKLKKELRLKQAEYDKEKAILLQKNEQLEAQLKETTCRQQAQVQMYETMINSLKAPEISAPSDIIVAKIQESERLAYEGEIAELKEHRKKLQEDTLDREREFARLTNDKDSFIKELQLQVDKVLMEKSQQMFQWEIERKDLQQRVQAGITDREQAERMLELKWQSKLSEQLMETERLKLEHMREVDRVRQECENIIQEVKAQHEQEKYTLEYRLDRQSHDLKSLHHMVIQQDSATNDTHASSQQHREQLNQELSHIQAEVDTIKLQYEQTLAQLTKEKESAEARNEKLQKQLDKLKNAPKQAAQVLIDLPLKVGTTNRASAEEASTDPEAYAALQRQVKNLKSEVELQQEENTKLGDQVKKLRNEQQEMAEYAERLEANEKKLRRVLEDQAAVEQEQVVELRRLLNQEKKRAVEQSEVMSVAKEALERENYRQATIINEKEEQLRQMTHELKSHEKKLYEIQSMFNGQPGVNQSCNLTENQILMNQRQIIRGQGSHFIAQSLANFSPRNFGAGINMPGTLQRQGSHQSMHLPHLERNNSFSSNVVNPGEGGVINAQIPKCQNVQGKVECAHCLQHIDSNDFCQHLKQFHPQNLVHTSLQSQQLIGLAGMNLSQQADYLSHTPQTEVHLPPRPPTSMNPLLMQSSPKAALKGGAPQISNSRSFNCLLKEIDEEEERHVVGSMLLPNGQLGRENNEYIVMQNEDDVSAGEGGGSLTQSRKSSIVQTSSLRKIRATNSSIEDSKTARSKASSKRQHAPSNITSEIKDLLDKLVAYQGGSTTQGHQHCQSVGNQSQQPNHNNMMINTESMVELRSSNASSLAFVPPPIKIDTGIELRAVPKQITKSYQIKESQRKQWNIQMMSQEFNQTNGEGTLQKKPHDFEIIEKSEASQAGRNLSISSSGSSLSSIDGRATAKHTSKDTLLSIPGKNRKGRRYHDVKKSDVITPNSPRRYQAYFKNRLHPTESTALPPKHFLIEENNIKQASKPKAAPTKENGVTVSQRTHKNHRYSPSNTKSIADESQYNQLSPSPEKLAPKSKLNLNGAAFATQQAADDSRMFLLNSSNPYNMPLQQVQNQLFAPSKQSNMKGAPYGTYDSGSVIYGGASDAIFKTQGTGSHLGQGAQLMFGGIGFGFQPNATLSTVKAGAPSNVHNFDGVINCSMDDDGEIRPSQLDEFIEVKTQPMGALDQQPQLANAQFPDCGSGIGPAHITSSYITIGDDDPFITGRFNDATTKAFNFKPQSHCPSKIHDQSIPLSKNSDMYYYQNQLNSKRV